MRRKASNALREANRLDALFYGVTAEALRAAPMISHPSMPNQKESTVAISLLLRTKTLH